MCLMFINAQNMLNVYYWLFLTDPFSRELHKTLFYLDLLMLIKYHVDRINIAQNFVLH